MLFALLVAGTLAGRVTVAGLAPKLANLPVSRDIKICGTAKPDESLVVGPGGGIRDAVVWVTDVKPARPAKERKKPKLDQEACAYVPHVLAAEVGSTIDIVNSDPLLHNVHADRLFNYAMPIKGHVIPTKLKHQGFHPVVCDVHPWMRAWLAVMPNGAFALTKEDGTFSIDNVPPGKHHVRLWHERLGERDGDVEVPESGAASFDVSLNPR